MTRKTIIDEIHLKHYEYISSLSGKTSYYRPKGYFLHYCKINKLKMTISNINIAELTILNDITDDFTHFTYNHVHYKWFIDNFDNKFDYNYIYDGELEIKIKLENIGFWNTQTIYWYYIDNPNKIYKALLGISDGIPINEFLTYMIMGN